MPAMVNLAPWPQKGLPAIHVGYGTWTNSPATQCPWPHQYNMS
jgi:hypothetical protein